MSVNATELVGKLNFVMSSRRFKEKGYIEDYPALPQTPGEEEDVVSDLMFAFVKKLFAGCKVRSNAHTYSLRLDGHIHRKANKLRDIYNNEQEWRSWFETQHNTIYRAMRENRQSFNNSSMLERRLVDDKIFLYIPKTPNRIYNYINHGLVEYCQWVENEYKKDERLAAVYDEAIRLMEAEITRREEERRQRIARELASYKEQIFKELFHPVAHLQESENAVDRLFAHKFTAWARENGKAPEYAKEATAQSMVTRGLRVKIMAPPGSEEEGWVALPPFEGYPELEGYEMQGWGKVTNIDMTSDRSRQGRSPIVVQEYLYTEFNLDHWRHLLPAEYAEVLEVTQRLRREAEAEIEPWLEQERIRKEREEEERRQAEEARKREQEEARRLAEEQRRQEEARQARLAEEAERIREQQAQQPVEEVEETIEEEPNQANPTLTEALRNQFNAEPERAATEGLYRNSRAIPLERYVAITASGTVRRFARQQAALEWLGYSHLESVEIRDFHAPHEIVERYDNENITPF
jgi:hypothetical protein